LENGNKAVPEHGDLRGVDVPKDFARKWLGREGEDGDEDDAEGGDKAAEPQRTFQVGAPEGTTIKWRPDYEKVELN
jgi:hypothetical protein